MSAFTADDFRHLADGLDNQNHRCEEVAALIERRRTALSRLVMVCGATGDSLDDFEHQARAFYQETGKLRPGKDAPTDELAGTQEDYAAWVMSILNEARACCEPPKKNNPPKAKFL
ncbi:MAG: hypothetical protein P1U84_05035 [Parvibaculaceae bacterium]|nr:hypothetical protein [Parvibaculaceae bacterium]